MYSFNFTYFFLLFIPNYEKNLWIDVWQMDTYEYTFIFSLFFVSFQNRKWELIKNILWHNYTVM